MSKGPCVDLPHGAQLELDCDQESGLLRIAPHTWQVQTVNLLSFPFQLHLIRIASNIRIRKVHT